MPIKIIFTCGREPEYPRNALIRKALSQNYELVEVTDNSRWLPFRYPGLLWKLYKVTRRDHDLVFIGFHGQILTLFAKLFTKKPIILDAFTSIYDTFCFDRNKFSPNSLMGKISYWLDKKSAKISDIICLDTQAHALYYHNTFQIPESKLKVFLVGSDEEIFYPRKESVTESLILFYGNYLPLHGVTTIIKAAKLVEKDHKIYFKLLGSGHDFKIAHELAKNLRVKNIEFLPPIPLQALPDFISQGDICLGGHFGRSEKASRVIAGKTYQCLAMAKPTIVGENPANHELLTHGFDAWFCEMDNADALAKAILTLLSDKKLLARLGQNGYQTFLQKASFSVIAAQICEIVENLVSVTRHKEFIEKN